MTEPRISSGESQDASYFCRAGNHLTHCLSRVVIKLYLVDAAQLLHHKLAHHLQV